MNAKPRSISRRFSWGSTLANVVTILAAGIWLTPLLFTALMSFRPPAEPVTQGNIFVGTILTTENYTRAWEIAPWPDHYRNSIIFVVGTLAVQLVTVTLAGYAFARMTFFGRDLLLILVLLQLMIPPGVLLAQNFATIRDLGLFDTHVAMMIPYWGSAFGTLLLRQAFREVPIELEEAARIDGATLVQVLRHVYVPLAVPTYIAFGVVSVSSHWNEFLWPLVVTQSESVRPLTVAINKLIRTADQGSLYSLLMAGTVLVIAPLSIVFMIFQRRFVESFASSGVK
ncbi:MAG TPA: carbohydrate ABC transporter permease [Aggregatilineales bacterium]|nr:carbohydrate ABC transporter permease [Aggregatilineales bacterium]